MGMALESAVKASLESELAMKASLESAMKASLESEPVMETLLRSATNGSLARTPPEVIDLVPEMDCRP